MLKINRMWNVGAMASVLITSFVSFGDIMYRPRLGVF
jgi:hypothetical protein